MKLCEVALEDGDIKVGNSYFNLDTLTGRKALALILRKVATDLDPYKDPDQYVMESYA